MARSVVLSSGGRVAYHLNLILLQVMWNSWLMSLLISMCFLMKRLIKENKGTGL